jgi:adenylate cyclase
MYGELVPLGGGDPIPLMKRVLSVGRRESNDIVLDFANISGKHCQLTVNYGYWYVKDLNSRNGIKVNNVRIMGDKRLDPGDTLSIAKHRYEVNYVPSDLGAVGPPPDEESAAVIFGKSLLERAGLSKKKADEIPDDTDMDVVGRYDPDADEPLKKRSNPPKRP